MGKKPSSKIHALIVIVNAIILTALSLYFLLIPAGILIHDLQDPGLQSNQIPQLAYRWHRQMTPGYTKWAIERVQSGQAATLNVHDIAGTEWPVFSSVYYLWATEALQADWQQNPNRTGQMPTEYAQEAIESAAALISDPNHATWVKQHWGEDYLETENLFYRMLLISGLSSYQSLTNNTQYSDLLAEQVNSLAIELDESPYGLLDDYPNQCYPIDILPAIAVIRRADKLLDTNHSAFAQRAIRGFQSNRLDPNSKLPAYVANSKTGQGIGPARGVGISYMLIWAPELWSDTASQWYADYETQFWQEQWGIVGFREFEQDVPNSNWLIDVDAGPVIGGFGTAANAFGIGAARANGRFDHAYGLGAEALIAALPLPNGQLMSARLLSNFSDAPYTGETALLFNFTRQTVTPNNIVRTMKLPAIVYIGMAVYILLGIAGILLAIRKLKPLFSTEQVTLPPYFTTQFLIWFGLVIVGSLQIARQSGLIGIILLLIALPLPRER